MRIYLVNPFRRPVFPEGLVPGENGLVAIGGVLSPEIVLEAYSKGIFPWTGEHPIPWFSPDPRAVLVPGEIKVTRSMRQVLRQERYQIRFDTDFSGVIYRCATIPRPGQDGTWITPNMLQTWCQLFEMGYSHSVEAYDDNGELVGGLYGMAMGRAFFGESMFSSAPNASKAALITLCRRLDELGFDFIDCQQDTDHLRRMGSQTVSHPQFLDMLRHALSDGAGPTVLDPLAS